MQLPYDGQAIKEEATRPATGNATPRHTAPYENGDEDTARRVRRAGAQAPPRRAAG
jgi:hypothetical protein